MIFISWWFLQHFFVFTCCIHVVGHTFEPYFLFVNGSIARAPPEPALARCAISWWLRICCCSQAMHSDHCKQPQHHGPQSSRVVPARSPHKIWRWRIVWQRRGMVMNGLREVYRHHLARHWTNSEGMHALA